MHDAIATAAAEVYEDSEAGPLATAWRIESLETADWALRRLGELEREMEENARVLAARVEELKARHGKLQARVQRGVEFFAGRLRDYADAHKAELLGGGKKKSRALLHGTIGWKTRPAGLEVTSKDDLLAWAQSQPVEAGLVRITEAPAMDAVKKHVAASGEVPPGVLVVEAREEFTAKAASVGAGEV